MHSHKERNLYLAIQLRVEPKDLKQLKRRTIKMISAQYSSNNGKN